MKTIVSLILITAWLVLSGCDNDDVSFDCKCPEIPDGICPAILKPVVGCDGKTYGNSCEAQTAGICSWTEIEFSY